MRSGTSDIQVIHSAGGPFAIAQTLSFKYPKVTADSSVVASVTEVDSNGKPFIGDVSLKILSVAPNDNGEIVVQVATEDEGIVRFRITWFVDP